MISTVIKDRYEITELLGHGGQGSTYKAIDKGLAERSVALKIIPLHERMTNDPRAQEAYQRFKREAEVTAQLNHPQIAQVFDYGIDEENHVAFMARQYLNGLTLQEHLKSEGPFSPEEGTGLVLSIAGVLEYLHEQGIVHRDIKPANVFLQHGIPVLIDFGLSHHEDKTQVSRTGQLLGTYSYIAPELITKDTRDEYRYSPLLDWWGIRVCCIRVIHRGETD